MKIKIFKTPEISPQNWEKIIDGFNRSFDIKKSIESLKRHYFQTRLGYSYHALAFAENGNLAGYNSLLPILYRDREGKDILIGVSGGTFVVPEYRKDIFIYSDMIKALFDYCSKEKMVASLGVSNENSFQYALKFMDATLISFLFYYALPVRIFNVVKLKKLSFLNFFSILASVGLIWLNLLISRMCSFSEKPARFEVVSDDQFFLNRFAGKSYNKISKNNVTSYYRVIIENGVRAVYLLDFRENKKRTLKALVVSIWTIMNCERPDIILFIGCLRLSQCLLIRVPRKLEPQPLPLILNITSAKYNYYFEPMVKGDNWNFGLMNFDVR